MIHKCERWKSSHRKNSGFTKKKKKKKEKKRKKLLEQREARYN